MKRYMICSIAASVVGVAMFGACSNPATGIAATGTALTAADTLALKYVTLPLCPAGATKMPDGTLCSSALISAQIKQAAASAYAAYKAAEANPTSTTAAAAAAALAALSSLIPPTVTTN